MLRVAQTGHSELVAAPPIRSSLILPPFTSNRPLCARSHVRHGLQLSSFVASRLASRRPRHSIDCEAYSASRAAGPGPSHSQYDGQGPYATATLPTINLALGQGQSGPVNLQLEVHHPKGHANAPLVILTAGFLLDSTLYRSYAEDLASWGYSVVLWDLSELFDDASTVRHMRSIIDSCTSDPRLSRYVDTGSIYLVGHSRGAKLSVLLAAQDVRVKGLCLLDPVDVTSMTPQGPGWGTCLPALRQITQPQGRCVPVLVVGAALNTDVVPPEGNYKKFVDACQGPCWGLTLKGASHLQFLDRQVGLLSIFSAEGPTPSAVVRRISKAAAAAWGHATATPHITTTIEPDVERLLRQEAAALGGLADIESRLWNMQFVGQSGRGAYMNMDSGSAEQATRSSRGTDQPPGARSRSTWSRSAAPPGPDKVWGPTAGASSTDTSSSTSTSTGSSSSNSNSNSYSTSNSSSSSNGNSTGPGSTAAPITDSYEMLLRRRAKELKQMLVERGVDCSDCFEKEDLARRILERCR